MKKPSIPNLISSLSVAFLALTNTAAFADDDFGGRSTPPPAVLILLEAQTKLAPIPTTGTTGTVTAAAKAPTTIPAGPFGSAELEVSSADGKTTAEVEIGTWGLATGTYGVTVTTISGTPATFTVGSFIVPPTVPPVAARGGFGDRRGTRAEFSTSDGTITDPLFNGFDVALITVSDSLGNPVLAGDLTQNVEKVTRVQMAPHSPAPVPAPSGVVTVSSFTRGGVTTPRSGVDARGLAPNTALQVVINGPGTPVTTTKRGRLSLSMTGVTATGVVSIQDNSTTPPAILLSATLP
jgi:hypothetical protein